MATQTSRDVFVLVPGIMGSVLSASQGVIWGPSMSATLTAIMSGSTSVACNLRLDPAAVSATALMPDVHLLPGFWKIDGYTQIRNFLVETMGLEPGANYFEFPYDWRLDNRKHGDRLKEATGEWLDQWRSRGGNASSRLVLIAHSMGGLVCRWFLEKREGWRDTRALISYGTPYRGAPRALSVLVDGLRIGPLRLAELSAAVATLESVYQLLPIYKCLDRGDGTLVRLEDIRELPNDVDVAAVQAGIAFHREIESAANANQKITGFAEQPYEIFPVVGIAQQTQQSARLTDTGIEMLMTHTGQDLGGDGTVPRVSATPIERSKDRKEMYNGTKHARLQNGDAVLTHVQGILSSLALDLGAFRGVAAEPQPSRCLTLEVDDVCSIAEPVVVRLRPGRATNGQFTATFTEEGSDTVSAKRHFERGSDGWYSVSLQIVVPGSYQVTVTSDDDFTPAEDVLCVLNPAAVEGVRRFDGAPG